MILPALAALRLHRLPAETRGSQHRLSLLIGHYFELKLEAVVDSFEPIHIICFKV